MGRALSTVGVDMKTEVSRVAASGAKKLRLRGVGGQAADERHMADTLRTARLTVDTGMTANGVGHGAAELNGRPDAAREKPETPMQIQMLLIYDQSTAPPAKLLSSAFWRRSTPDCILRRLSVAG